MRANGGRTLGFKRAVIRVPAVLNSREAAPDPAGRGRGWGFQPVSSHLPRTSLLPAAPQVTAWHQHTKTSIPSASGRKKTTFSPLVPQGRWSLDYTCSFSTHKNYATCTPHTERYGVCMCSSTGLPHAHLFRHRHRWRGASAAGISQALCDSPSGAGSTWLQPSLLKLAHSLSPAK